MSLETGDEAPAFALPGPAGATVRLADFKGRKVALFFYPKANTSLCIAEAQDFERLAGAFAEAGTAVVGVSRDPMKAVDKFREKQGLSLPLATDEDGRMLEAYGVWVEKTLYGHRFMGVERATFLIDAKGRVARIWRKVRVKGHAEEVLEAAKAL
jgi:peroxiredoxin Q/BCP